LQAPVAISFLMEKTQINGGRHTCGYCGGKFRENRYEYIDDSEQVSFCLPECFVGYHYHVLGHDSESQEERDGWMQDYKDQFQRTVHPAPFSCYLEKEKRPREQWLAEVCRNDRILQTEKERSQARLELYIQNQENASEDDDEENLQTQTMECSE
jgi:hypothetical protein